MPVNLKIIIATGTYPPEVSGQANFVYHLSQKLLAAGVKIKIISYGHSRQSSPNPAVVFIRRNFWRHLNYFWSLKKISNWSNLIFAQDLFSSGLPAALVKTKKHKLILRLGGDFLWEKAVNSGKCRCSLIDYYRQPKNWQEKIYLAVYKFVLSRSDKIIFTSQLQADIYKKYFKLPDYKIVIIINPIEINHITVSSRDKKSVNNEIIFTGRFIALKNLKRLIYAFRQLQTNKQLVLIGDGPQKKDLLELIQADTNIKIESYLPQPILWQRIARAYLFILPSITDLSPNVALEALALNIPVILTKENGLPKEIKNYFKLINPFSIPDIKTAIAYFLDSANYQNWSKSLDLDFSAYTWPIVAKKYLEIFNLYNL